MWSSSDYALGSRVLTGLPQEALMTFHHVLIHHHRQIFSLGRPKTVLHRWGCWGIFLTSWWSPGSRLDVLFHNVCTGPWDFGVGSRQFRAETGLVANQFCVRLQWCEGPLLSGVGRELHEHVGAWDLLLHDDASNSIWAVCTCSVSAWCWLTGASATTAHVCRRGCSSLRLSPTAGWCHPGSL